jgi:branched-chain amino acid transport system permease protein
MNFFLSYIIVAEIFVIMALSTNFLVGVIGIFSVSQAALMGVGAYAFAVSVKMGMPFAAALVLAIVLCGALNLITSLPSLRLEGDYFVVTSFGIQLVATAVFINWTAVTGGASGISGIPAPTIFGYSAEEPQVLVFLTTLAMLIAGIGYWLLMRSSYGRILHAIRLNELAVIASGRDVLGCKLGISAISGGYAGAAGALYAVFLSFIDPTSFDIHVSVLILTMLVVGGARTLVGSILGPFLLLAIPQLLALVSIPPTLVGPARALVYGMLLVAFMMWRPQGLAGRTL